MLSPRSILISFFAVIFLFACRKSQLDKPLFDGQTCTGTCYILQGRVFDSAAGTGIAGAQVKFWFRPPSALFGPHESYLGQSITAADGRYSFRFDGTNYNRTKGYFYAEAFKDNLFHDPVNGNQVSIFDLDSTLYNQPFIQDFPLFRPATLRVRVIASTVTSFQFLNVGYHYGRQGYGYVFNGGRSIDTTLVFKTAGDIATILESDAVGNGINIKLRDTIRVPAGLTRQVEVRL